MNRDLKRNNENEITFNVSDECMNSLKAVSTIVDGRDIKENYSLWMERFLCLGMLVHSSLSKECMLDAHPELRKEYTHICSKACSDTNSHIVKIIEEILAMGKAIGLE